jgi:hypothetical protein
MPLHTLHAFATGSLTSLRQTTDVLKNIQISEWNEKKHNSVLYIYFILADAAPAEIYLP